MRRGSWEVGDKGSGRAQPRKGEVMQKGQKEGKET